MGKMIMELVWGQNVVAHTNRPVILLTPLAVSSQMAKEAEKFGIQAARSKDGNFPQAKQIIITNYERLHYFKPRALHLQSGQKKVK